MKQIYLFLAVLLLVCLAPMPYGYYQLVRFVAMVAFAIMAYIYYDKKQIPLAIIFGSLTLLFQPFVKVALGRVLWNVVDVIVAIGLFTLWWKDKKNRII